MGTRLYLLSQGYNNLRKHSAKTFSTMFIICATMIVLGLFIIAFENIQENVNVVATQQGIQAFISDDVKESEIEDILTKINSVANVDEIKYLDKEDALEDAKNTLQNYDYLLQGLESSNPFPRSFVIIFKDLEDTASVKTAVESIDGIYNVKYNEDIINAVITISNIAKFIVFGVGAFMVIISIFIISNTIKLAVYSNKREIYIMKYIGATCGFIKAPFIVEGIFMGIGSALISWITISLGYIAAYSRLPKVGSALGVFGVVAYSEFWYVILIAFVALGIFLGGVGSSIATSRYLKDFKPLKCKSNKKNNNEKQIPEKINIENKKDVKTNKKKKIKEDKKENLINKQKVKEQRKIDKEKVKEEKMAEEKKKVGRRAARNIKKRRYSIIFALVIAFSMMFTTVFATTNSTIDGIKDDLEDLNNQKENILVNYENTENDISIYTKELEKLNVEVEKYTKEVEAISEKTLEITEEVAVLEAKLQDSSISYEVTRDLLNTRLRVLYENGFVNMWQMLFTSSSVSDFMTKYNVIVDLIAYDQEMLSSMETQKEYINNIKKDAELRKLQIEQAEYDVTKSKEALESAKASKEAKLEKLESSKAQLAALKIEIEKKTAAANAKLAAEIAKLANYNQTFSGEYNWPTSGVYLIYSMYRDKGRSDYHRGIDISRSSGANIVAAQSGKVVKVVNNINGKTCAEGKTYGNYIIIDHGRNTVTGKNTKTLYAHLAYESINVSVGQIVSRGQKIAYMGTTGCSTGTHLHFEVLENNATTDPALKYYGMNLTFYWYGSYISYPWSNYKAYQK